VSEEGSEVGNEGSEVGEEGNGDSLFHDGVAEAVAEGVVLVANHVRALGGGVFAEGHRRPENTLQYHVVESGGGGHACVSEQVDSGG
jgi:hypothetical protein